MVIVSELIRRIAQAADPAINPVSEGIDLQETLNPVIVAPLPSALGLSGVARVSTVRSAILQVANAGSSQTTLITFGRGLWQVTITAIYASNFDGGVNITGSLQIFDPPGNLENIIAFSAPEGAFTQEREQFHFNILLREDLWGLQLNLAANGVGQSHRIIGTMVASKLL